MAVETQADAEALGWTFDTTTETRQEPVEVTVWHAAKAAGTSQVVKTAESEDALLADIGQWEAAQPIPPAPVIPPVADAPVEAAPVEAAPPVASTAVEDAPVAPESTDAAVAADLRAEADKLDPPATTEGA